MVQQVPVTAAAVAEGSSGALQVVRPDLAVKRLAIVNVVMVGLPDAGDRGWVLVDAGVIGSKSAIVAAAAERFGAGARPSAIVLTHGHISTAAPPIRPATPRSAAD